MTTVPTDRELAQLKFDLDRNEREQKRQVRREHGERWHIWNESTRNLMARCGFCGRSAASHVGTTRVVAREWAGAGALGHLSLGFCALCGNLYRTYFDRREAEALTFHESLKRANMADYYPLQGEDEAASIRANNRRARAGLSWAGWAFRARQAGADDPGDPEVAFSHLSGLTPDVIDFAPSQPEPKLARRLPVS